MSTERTGLTRERILRAAIQIADERGMGALSMRKLGERLGVEAMSLYHHVANKEGVLEGMADLVVAEIARPEGRTWKEAMRVRARSVRAVLLAHPWAAALIESRRELGEERLHHAESVLSVLRDAGFSPELAYRAFLALDSYVYGFALQEGSWAFEGAEREERTRALAPRMAESHPRLAEVARLVMEKGVAGYEDEFGFGLELLLEGLARARRRRR